MRRALEAARRGTRRGEAPFGCVIWSDGEVVAEACNTTRSDDDVTAHAEINALRRAGRRLDGAVVATTCEPCPMCMGALLWAGVDIVLYGATIEDARAAGFDQFDLSARDLTRLSGGSLHLVPHVLREACRALMGIP